MIKKRQLTLNLWMACVAVASAPAAAMAMADPLIEGARLCTQHFPVEEKNNQIPTHLLAAIATTESGRWHEGLGMSVPWPWTINVDGKGYYFSSKAEAIAQTQKFLAQGRQSIDVGCMQVNLKHHPKAFANLEDAFDPKKNVNYAAGFLHDNYASLGDWIKATAAYHSRTPQYGARYLGEIERSWNRIVAKVASARAGKAGETTAVASAMTGAAPSRPPATPAKKMQPLNHARVIQVHDVATSERRESPVMVVRAEPVTAPLAAAPVAVAQVATPSEPVPVGNSIRQVSLDNNTSAALARPSASAPKFVFAN